MGNVENASAATRTTKTVKSLPMPKVWAFAVGQFGWALLSGIISNWLVYFYQPDGETISQGQTVFVPQGLAVLGVVTVVGGITAFGILPQAIVANIADASSKTTGQDRQGMFYAARTFAMKMGQSVAMLLFTGVSTIGMASGAGYRIAAVCAAVLCGIGGVVFAFYNERKVLDVLES